MNRPFSPPGAAPDTYETDFARWAHEQAALIRAGATDALDWDNVAEELESLGNEQEHSIESHLIRVLEHLLKLDHSDDHNPRNGWKRSIREQRRQLERRFAKNPSLFARRGEILAYCWRFGRDEASDGLRADEAGRLPSENPYPVDRVLDPTYFGEREAPA
jgi:hypothetical protein